MLTRTKIVCTLGPACNSKEKISALLDAGMNVARLNFSHGTYEEHAAVIARLKAAREEKGLPLAIMLDTKGPEIRLGKLKGGELTLKEGDKIWLVRETVEGSAEQISLTPSFALDTLEKDMFVLLDNGYIITHVVAIDQRGVQVIVDNGGSIRSTRGVNIPGVDVALPALTAKDIDDIRFGCEQDVDLVAASFVRSPEHVLEIKKLLESCCKPDIAVIAKIENRMGVQNFDRIADVADGIMVARGDLGVEMPLTQVPRLQKMMIRKCHRNGKPSVTATQMLESMIMSPRPTRAEASDVANAIYDSTSAVMLSGETAVGNYPVEAVKMMRAIVEESENDFDYDDFLQHAPRLYQDVPSAVALASIKTAYSAGAKAIFACSTSGQTARYLSRLRPQMPIIVLTSTKKVYHQLSVVWGVIPLYCEEVHSIEGAFKKLSTFALEGGYVKYGDLVVITGGTPFGRAGTTNMMFVDSIGDILVRGTEGKGKQVDGKVTLELEAEEYTVRGKILVLSECSETTLPYLKHASGIVLDRTADNASIDYLKEMAAILELPYILHATNALEILREGQLITLDPEHALVYKGIL